MIVFTVETCNTNECGLDRLLTILKNNKIIFDTKQDFLDEVCEQSYYGGYKNKSKYTISIFPRDNEETAIKELLSYFGIKFDIK